MQATLFFSTIFPKQLNVIESKAGSFPRRTIVQVIPHHNQYGCTKGCGSSHNEKSATTIIASLYSPICPRSIPAKDLPMSNTPYELCQYTTTPAENFITVPQKYLDIPTFKNRQTYCCDLPPPFPCIDIPEMNWNTQKWGDFMYHHTCDTGYTQPPELQEGPRTTVTAPKERISEQAMQDMRTAAGKKTLPLIMMNLVGKKGEQPKPDQGRAPIKEVILTNITMKVIHTITPQGKTIVRYVGHPAMKSKTDYRSQLDGPTPGIILSNLHKIILTTTFVRSFAFKKTLPKPILGKAPNAVNHSNSASSKDSHCNTIKISLVYRSSLDFNTHTRSYLFNITPIKYQQKEQFSPKYSARPVPKTQHITFNKTCFNYKYQPKHFSAYRPRYRNICKVKTKRARLKFDSTLGYPGEGPPNEVAKYNIVSLNIGGAGTPVTEHKYRNLTTWMEEAKIDILCVQETRSLTNHRIADTITDSRSEFFVLEAPNTQCHTHGGVAIIYRKHVQLKLIGIDNETAWWDTLTETEQNKLPKKSN
jgi:hypothetical protein